MALGIGDSRGRRGYMAEINVTPLVDVMLVLLIIFMVTAPMMTKGLDVRLPEVTSKALPQKRRPVTITMDAKGRLYLDRVRVDLVLLQARLAQVARGKTQVLLRADREVPYGEVAKVMAVIRKAGVEDLGLVTWAERVRPPRNKGGKSKGPRG